MNIPKAIEVLTRWKEESHWESEKELAEAEQLGIEALKVIKDKRGYPEYIIPRELPGETKD